MAKHLPDPPGEPDPAAAEIIAAIHAYRDSEADPVTITGGLRHIYHAAELDWDHSVATAKASGATYAAISQVTGDALGTLQGRIRGHHRRRLQQAPRRGRRTA